MTDAAAAQRRVLVALGGEVADPVFRLDGWDAAGDTATLHYRIDGLGEFTETVRFPGHDVAAAAAEDPAVHGALTLLSVAAATSYYKVAIPRRVTVGAVGEAAIAMLTALLTHGLAEFAARNDLDLTGWVDVEATDVSPSMVPAPAARGRTDGQLRRTPDAGDDPTGARRPPSSRRSGVLIPLGGGKDSAVTASLAVRAGWDALAFAVNPRPSMRRTAAATGLGLLTAERRLDPRLLELNAAGALNGHVPITAIVASIGCVAATLTGRGDVLLSNEASADEPTRIVDGRPINHQYSKSSAFEALHVAAADDLTGGATRAVSVLRPLPELVVAAAFAQLATPLEAVNSCNRAYSLASERREWCGRCPKCLFVELMLAPFTTPMAFRAATGFDALADPDLVDAYEDLRDPARKPYECVGTIAEVQLAFDLLAADPAWATHPAVVAHGRVDDAMAPTGDAPHARLRQLLGTVDTSTLPAPYDHVLLRLVDELRASAAAGSRADTSPAAASRADTSPNDAASDPTSTAGS